MNENNYSEFTSAILKRKQAGKADEEIIEILIGQGMDVESAKNIIKEIIAAALNERMSALRRVSKLESILDMHRLMQKTSSLPLVIDELHDTPSSKNFLELFYSKNKPVVLRNFLSQMPATLKWTPEYIREQCAGARIEIMSNRSSSIHYERDRDNHRTSICIDEYVQRITSEVGNDIYMTANNNSLFNSELSKLLSDVCSVPGIISNKFSEETIDLWFGPRGTVTPLHHDRKNVLLAQVYGRKVVKLIPANQINLLYNSHSFYSDVDIESPDFNKFPRFKDASIYEVVLNPGDAIFLPVLWWHHVKSLDVSISLSLSGFYYSNNILVFDV